MKTRRRLSVLLTLALGAALTTGAFAQGNGRGRGGGGGNGGDNTPPAAITDLSEVAVSHNSLTFTWTATGDDGVEGVAESYDLRYATFPIDPSNWNDAAQAVGEPAPGAPGTLEQYTLGDLPPETIFYMRCASRTWTHQLSRSGSGTQVENRDDLAHQGATR